MCKVLPSNLLYLTLTKRTKISDNTKSIDMLEFFSLTPTYNEFKYKTLHIDVILKVQTQIFFPIFF